MLIMDISPSWPVVVYGTFYQSGREMVADKDIELSLFSKWLSLDVYTVCFVYVYVNVVFNQIELYCHPEQKPHTANGSLCLNQSNFFICET